MNGSTKKHLTIDYTEFDYGALDTPDALLVERAIKACQNSYSPYSHYKVGAALRLSNGTILTGSNQENAAFPVCMCAERSVLLYAHANYPDQHVVSMAIAAMPQQKETPSGTEDLPHPELSIEPASPCGTCRQALLESEMRGKTPIRLLTAGARTIRIFDSIRDLIPFGFVAIV